MERDGCSGIVGRMIGRFVAGIERKGPGDFVDMSITEREAFAKARMSGIGKTAQNTGSNLPDSPPAGRHMDGGMPVDRE